VFAGLLVGAMLPYWFSAMTMKSVGKAALAMVQEVRRQFNTINGLMEGTARPDYSRCVKISTDSSLREMIPPGEWRLRIESWYAVPYVAHSSNVLRPEVFVDAAAAQRSAQTRLLICCLKRQMQIAVKMML
jgi:hypothetical protein